MNSAYSLQCPRKPYSCGFTDRARTSAEVRGSKDVGHFPGGQHALLTSWCSWSAIFLYVYTGQITFTNLGSQGVTTKEEDRDGCSQGEGTSPQDSGGSSVPSPGAVAVEPCSPKSVYCLADKVRLTPLRGDVVIDSSFA